MVQQNQDEMVSLRGTSQYKIGQGNVRNVTLEKVRQERTELGSTVRTGLEWDSVKHIEVGIECIELKRIRKDRVRRGS